MMEWLLQLGNSKSTETQNMCTMMGGVGSLHYKRKVKASLTLTAAYSAASLRKEL